MSLLELFTVAVGGMGGVLIANFIIARSQNKQFREERFRRDMERKMWTKEDQAEFDRRRGEVADAVRALDAITVKRRRAEEAAAKAKAEHFGVELSWPKVAEASEEAQKERDARAEWVRITGEAVPTPASPVGASLKWLRFRRAFMSDDPSALWDWGIHYGHHFLWDSVAAAGHVAVSLITDTIVGAKIRSGSVSPSFPYSFPSQFEPLQGLKVKA